MLNSNDTQNMKIHKTAFFPIRNKTGNGKLQDIIHIIHLGTGGSTRGAMIIRGFGYKWYLRNLFCLEGLRKNLSRQSQQPSQETTQTSPKYKSTVLNDTKQFYELYFCTLHGVTHVPLFVRTSMVSNMY